MKAFDAFARKLAVELLGHSIMITYADDPGWNFGGAYGNSHLTVNARRFGQSFFDSCLPGKPHKIGEVLSFLLHEFAHEYESNHLSDRFHNALCELGSKLALAIADGRIELKSVKKLEVQDA